MQLQASNVQECVKDFDKAIALDANNSDIYHHRGQVCVISFFGLHWRYMSCSSSVHPKRFREKIK